MILFRQWYAARNLPGTAGLNVRHLQYIATRPGAVPNHGQTFGLWGRLPGQVEAADQASLKEAKEAVRTASQIHTIYRAVLSSNREDAENYGLYRREKWEELLRKNLDTVRKEMRIAPEDFYWTASFHAELGHPHVHLLYWDNGKDPQKEGLSEDRTKIMSEHVRAAFGRDVYQEDLHLFQVHQRELAKEMRQQIQAMCREANPERSLDMKKLLKRPELEDLSRELLKICRAVPKSGSLKYAYLPPEFKAQVDRLTDRCLREIPELTYTLEEYKSATVQISELYGNGEEAQAHNLDKALGKLRKELGNEVMSAVREVLDMLPPEDPPQPYDHEPEPSPEPAEPAQAEECSVPFAQNTGDVAELPEEIPEPKEETPNLEEAGPEHEPDVSNAEPGDDTWGGRPKRPRLGGEGSRGNTWWSKAYREARAILYGNETTESNPEAALPQLIQEAEKGNGFAAYDAGRLYLSGAGPEQDDMQAQKWFSEAFRLLRTDVKKSPSGFSYYRLGQMSLAGLGTEVDQEQAMAYWEESAKLGNNDARYRLARMYLMTGAVFYSPEKAAELLEAAVQEGHTQAAYLLGKLLFQGTEIPQDIPRAAELLEKAAADEKNPNAYAAYTLGKLLVQEDSLDIEKGLRYLEQAAEAGNHYAEYQLGKVYFFGKDGVLERDQEKGLAYLHQAVEHGNEPAKELLEYISRSATANMLRGMMLLASQLTSQRSAQAQTGQRNRSRDLSREQKKDRQAEQSQAGGWEME